VDRADAFSKNFFILFIYFSIIFAIIKTEYKIIESEYIKMENSAVYSKETINKLIYDIIEQHGIQSKIFSKEISSTQIDNHINEILGFIDMQRFNRAANIKIQKQIKTRNSVAKNYPYRFTQNGVCIIALLTSLHYISYKYKSAKYRHENYEIFYEIIKGKFEKKHHYYVDMYDIILDMLEKNIYIVNRITLWLLENNPDISQELRKNLDKDEIRERLLNKKPKADEECNKFDLFLELYKRIDIFEDEIFTPTDISEEIKNHTDKKMKTISVNLSEYLNHMDFNYLQEERAEEPYLLVNQEVEEIYFLMKFYRVLSNKEQLSDYDAFMDLWGELESIRHGIFNKIAEHYDSEKYIENLQSHLKKRMLKEEDIIKFKHKLEKYKEKHLNDEDDSE